MNVTCISVLVAVVSFFSCIPAVAAVSDNGTSPTVLDLKMGPFSVAQQLGKPVNELLSSSSPLTMHANGAREHHAVPQLLRALKKKSKSRPGKGRAIAANSVAPPVLGCRDISVGLVYQDNVPETGYFNCYQFVINEKSKIDGQVSLPSGTTGFIGLYAVDPVTGDWQLLDSDGSTAQLLFAQTVNQSVRVVLAFLPDTGNGGTFLFGAFNRPGFDQYEPNDKLTAPSQAMMNKTISANIDVTGVDQDYYFFPMLGKQTNAKAKITFSSTQVASIMVARRDANGVYSVAPEWQVPSNLSGQTFFVNNLTPSNAEFTYGVLVRVASNGSGTPNSQPYTLSMRSNDSYVMVTSEINNENLTRYFPQGSGYLQVYSYITLQANVKRTGLNGVAEAVAGEDVLFSIQEQPYGNSPVTSVSGVSNSTGIVSGTLNMPQPRCFGTIPANSSCEQRYGPFSQPPQIWGGRAQFGTYQVIVPGSSANVTPAGRQFFHVCYERYYGNRAPAQPGC